MKIFISGNGNLSFSDFITYYGDPIRPYLLDKNVSFLLCDYKGVDTLMMEFLKCDAVNVTIYHIGEHPRYLPDKYRTKVHSWKLIGGFEDDATRDHAAILDCTHFLAFDFNSSEKRISGTTKNIEICESLGKIRI